MRSSTLAGLALSLAQVMGVWGYGTTVSIAVSYCPASSTLATGTGSATPTSSPAPSPTPFLIYIAQTLTKRANLQYISFLGGTINTDPGLALTWTITAMGQLMTDDGRHISASGLDSQNFFPASSINGISTLWAISANGTVSWTNGNFPLGRAGFCLSGSNIWIYFSIGPPTGCIPVVLGAIPKGDVMTPSSSPSVSIPPTLVSTTPIPNQPTPGTLYGTLATAEPVGCITSSIGSLALSSQNTIVATLEQCVDVCAGYITTGIDYHYVGAQFGTQCYCDLTLNPASRPAPPGSCNLPCSGSSNEMCGGNQAMAVYVIVSRTPTSSSIQPPSTTTIVPSGSGWPTSTGDPNCFDGSSFDGTVNGNYLILCDTTLPGFDVDAVAAIDLTECIGECSSFVPGGNGDHCVAVEYDILATVNPCKLKSGIGHVDRGGNLFAQAAILVDVPGAPPIVFGTSTSAGAPTSTPSVGTTAPAPVSTTIATSSTVKLTSSTLTTTTTTILSSALSAAGTSSTALGSSVPTSRSFVLSSSPSRTSSTSVSSSTFSTVSGYPLPTSSSLCPTYNHQVLNVNGDGYPYEVECGTTLVGATLGGNSTTAVSLQACISFCTIYNIALPYECLGVSYTGSTQGNSGANCYLLESITGTVCTPGTDGGRLILPQYQAPTDQVCGAVSSTSQALSFTSSGTSRTSSSSPSSAGPSSVSTMSLQPSSSPTFMTPASSPSASTSPSLTFSGLTSIATSTSASAAASTSAPTSRPPSSSSSSTATSHLSSSSSNASSPPSPSSSTTSSPSSSSINSSTSTSAGSSRTTTTSSLSSAASSSFPSPSSMTTTPPPSSRTTSPLTSTTPFSQSRCPPAPTGTDGYNTECPSPTNPSCYYYDFSSYGYPSANYEVECGTSFAGASLAPGLNIDLEDCIYYCAYANYLASSSANPPATPACVGVTFNNTLTGQGVDNNCIRYSSITCATRGDSTVDSARLLWAGYPAMVDYAAGFTCPGP